MSSQAVGRLPLVLAALMLPALAGCAGGADRPEAPAVRWDTGRPAVANQELYAFDEIRAGDYAAAERKLLDTARLAEDDPYRLLNLALVLQMTGRGDEAAALYGRVLEMEANPRAAVASGFGRPVKDIAESALARLDDGGI